MPPMRVNAVKVRAADFAQTLVLSATVTARHAVAVSSTLAGERLVSVHVEAGDRVRKGDTLAILEGVENHAQLRAREALFGASKKALDNARSQLKEAQSTCSRYRQLRLTHAVSALEIDQQEARLEAAQSALAAAQADMIQKAQELRISRHEDQKTVLRSPVSGFVIARRATLGELAGAEPLVTIARDGVIELEAEVNSAEMAELKQGMAVSVTVPGDAAVRAAVIRLIEPQIDAATRLGKIRMALHNTEGLFVGSYATVRLALPVVHREVTLPVLSIVFDSENSGTVLRLDEKGRVSQVKVSVGKVSADRAEILTGLSLGDTVVHKAQAFLSDGETVSVHLLKD